MAISVRDFAEKKKGTNDYTEPVFNLTPISAATNDEALRLTRVLKEYHDVYFKKPIAEEVYTNDVPDNQEQTKDEQSNSLYGYEPPPPTAKDAPPEPPEEEEDDLPF